MTSPPLVVFEDAHWQRLLPLVYMRAVFQLVCGMDDLLAKALRAASTQETAVWCRPLIAELVAEETQLPANAPLAGPALMLNGRGLWTTVPEVLGSEAAWVGIAGSDEQIACIAADAALASQLSPAVMLDETRLRVALAGVPRRDVGAHVTLLSWPWEVVLHNERALVADWQTRGDACGQQHGTVDEGSYLLQRGAIHIGAGARVKPCVVIDAEDGPVWIGRNVTIQPHTYVQGPACIGDGTLLQAHATVRAGTTIGPRCKVGGEIEASIIQGYSNKQHDGFLGHSYIGSWVNIAADCINSDLKNTYGNIRVPINGRDVDSGEMFVGMLMGDYSKAGINVSFPTGAVIGFCSSIFAPQSPKFVPSFAWIDSDSSERYDAARGLALARKVMARRDRVLTAAAEKVFMAVRQQALAIELQPQMALERNQSG